MSIRSINARSLASITARATELLVEPVGQPPRVEPVLEARDPRVGRSSHAAPSISGLESARHPAWSARSVSRGCNGRRSRTSAWRAGPRRRSQSATTIPSSSYSGPAITSPQSARRPPHPRGRTPLALRERDREVVGERARGDELRHRHDERARLDRDVAHRREPAVAVVGGRRDPDLGPAAIYRIPGERHPVLPADQAADPRAAASPRRGRRRRRSRGTGARGGSASASGGGQQPVGPR